MRVLYNNSGMVVIEKATFLFFIFIIQQKGQTFFIIGNML